MFTQHALLYFYSSPLPSCQLYVYLASSTLLLFITTTLMLAICIPSMLYFTSIHHHCPHASYMYTQHALLYFYSSTLHSYQLYVYLACSTLLLFITTALMLAICIPSMLYFISIHHHCPHASYMYTQHALLYFYSSPLPTCQLYVYLACSTLLLFITTALMLAICVPSMLYFTSIHHHCPHASYMYTQHPLLYFYSSPLPSCQLYVYLACFTLLLFITTALMLAICITSMLYFTSIHHHCPHASYMYTQHALLYFYSSPLPSCQLYVYLACSTLLLYIITTLMLAICIPSMLYYTSIHHHCPHASYMYTQHALLYFYLSPLPSCQIYVYLACSALHLFIITALMLAKCIPSMLYFTSIHHHCPHASCIPSMLYFTSIHHHCPHASYMYTQHALLYFYSSPLPSCQLYVYLACSTLLLFITTALMLAICITSMLYTSIHHHCPHASYMYTQHALLYFYSSPLPSCQLYVYLACSTLLLFITTALMLAICIPSMLYFTSIHHHCPHASYMYTQHALLYFYSSPLPSCQLYVYLACSTLLLFIITALMLAICIPSMLYFTSIHHHCPHASYMYTQHATLLLFITTCPHASYMYTQHALLYFHHHSPHASYMYTQHALLYFYSSPLPSCQLYVYLACSTLLLFITTALMLAICIPSMLYFTSIHHHCPHASYMYTQHARLYFYSSPRPSCYMYTQHALLYFYSSPLPSCQLYVYLACFTLLLFITTALMLAICIPSMLYFTSIHHHCPHASYMYTQHALLYFYSSPLPSCQLFCIPSMLYFTSIDHHCPHASYMYTQHALLYFYSSPLPSCSYMYTQHALLYFYSSPLPSCQLYVYLACFTLLLFIITALMLAICIPSMLYFTSIHHHCPHASYMYTMLYASYMYTQHSLFMLSSLPSCQLYVYLACSTLLLFITTALMLAICIPSTSILYFIPLPSCQLYVYLACFTLLLFIITALMLAICIPSMLYFTSIHHHCPHASYMYTQHALLYFYSSPLPSCQLYVYLACSTLLLFIITALMLAICKPSMLYFNSIHHHCHHASYMYTQHAPLYFYSSSLPSCQLYVYLACFTLFLFVTTALMLAICIPSMLYFTSIHHHCPHASYMYTQHAPLYFYSSSLPPCQLYVYLACFTLFLFIPTALMLAICIPSMLYFTSIHHHCPHASYMYTQHALLYFYSSPLTSCQLYVYLASFTLLLFITTALMLAICIPSMLYFISIHHH